MNDRADFPDREIRIDRRTGERAANWMRVAITQSVLHEQGPRSLHAMQQMEYAALLLEGYPWEEAKDLSVDIWKPGNVREADLVDPGRFEGTRMSLEEKYLYQKAEEVNRQAWRRNANLMFLDETFQQMCDHAGLSPEEFIATFNSKPSDPARQKLLTFIPATEEEIAEKIARRTEGGGESSGRA